MEPEKRDVDRAAIASVGRVNRFCDGLKGHRLAQDPLLRAWQAPPPDPRSPVSPPVRRAVPGEMVRWPTCMGRKQASPIHPIVSVLRIVRR